MKRIYLSIVLSILSLSVIFGQSIQDEVNAHLKNLPFETFSITVPTFPNKTFNIKDKGAIGNGVFKNTAIINSTIQECSKAGGGVVLVPPGIYVTGPITMASNVNLHISEGATILFSGDIEDYPLVESGSGKFRMPSLINGSGFENVAITGTGIINGNGDKWRPIKHEKRNEKQWKALDKKGGEFSADGKFWYPRRGTEAAIKLKKSLNQSDMTPAQWEEIRLTMRSYTLNVEKVKNMLVEGITMMNSPHITNMLREIDGLVMKDVKVLNEWWYQNADGLDISRCNNVLLYNCTVNTGDDGICMKSSGGEPGKALLENIVIKDCKVYHGHGGFVIGSNTDGGMNNIYVKNLTCSLTDVGLRFKSDVGRGGKVSNVFIEDVFMTDMHREAITFNLTYKDRGAITTKDFSESTAKVPAIDGIHFKNIYCYGAKEACVIGGVDKNLNIKNLTFENMIIQASQGVKAYYSEGITFDNVDIVTDAQPAFYLKNVKGFTFKNMKGVPETGAFIKVLGPETKGIVVENSPIKAAQVEMINDAPASELKIK